jgi:hypothetical protein
MGDFEYLRFQLDSPAACSASSASSAALLRSPANSIRTFPNLRRSTTECPLIVWEALSASRRNSIGPAACHPSSAFRQALKCLFMPARGHIQRIVQETGEDCPTAGLLRRPKLEPVCQYAQW